ncbi:hypothetical protein LZY01_23670 [Levilactobacillus zymae]|uniref:Replication terminator protein n=1 Tax=Levilactobacillus zymae TaxID=267363 RepID=A0ABQ0WZ59_9LACO|nr:hypothetical protein [Levilactobacillus zymae]QFR61036.1 replication terminator protein [Levilactobacillus zymae]GEO73199.1 hypothetical protein LZY01_23670 [Levilactobacillus zymae]
MSKNKLVNIDLTDMANGAIQEKLDTVMDGVLENILNPNCEAKKKRKVTITLSMTPTETRNSITLDAQVKSTLVPEDSATTTILVGRNSTGRIEANELKSGTPGQTYIDPDDGKLKDDKGTDIDKVEAEGKNQTAKASTIIDFQHSQKKESN